MKATIITFLLALAGFLPFSAGAQETKPADSLGLPGDNLNLYAVLDLFQQSETFEIFEKKLNAEDSKINNLDLNNDDKTDYIKVIDHQTGDNHIIVLQVPVTEKENQDVAVIEIEKNKDGKISLQIIGNEELYGKDYIVEPKENEPEQVTSDKTTEAKTPANNYATQPTTNVYVTVNQWPMVQYIYTPGYVVYASPWYWYHYPVWWKPWRPWYFHHYYWHHYHHRHHYYGWYHRTPYYRNSNAHSYYGPRRMSSATVQTHRKAGAYNKTYTGKRDKPASTNPGYQPHRRQGNYKQGNLKQNGIIKEGAIKQGGNKQGGVKPNRVNPNNNTNVKPQQHQPRQKAGKQPHKPTQGHQPKSGGKTNGGGARKR